MNLGNESCEQLQTSFKSDGLDSRLLLNLGEGEFCMGPGWLFSLPFLRRELWKGLPERKLIVLACLVRSLRVGCKSAERSGKKEEPPKAPVFFFSII